MPLRYLDTFLGICDTRNSFKNYHVLFWKVFSFQKEEDLLQIGRTLWVFNLDTHELLSVYVDASAWIHSFYFGPGIITSLLLDLMVSITLVSILYICFYVQAG